MKTWKEIKFISPVNKGEEFSLGSLLKEKNNNEIIIEYFDNELDLKYEEFRKLVSSNSKKELENEKLTQRVELEKEIRKEMRNEWDKDISVHENKVSLLETQLKADKTNHANLVLAKDNEVKSKNEELIRSIQDKNKIQNTFDKMKDVFEEQYQRKLNQAREELLAEVKFANVIGDKAENEIRDEIKEVFNTDSIVKPNHSKGEADIYQEIISNDKKIGTIYYEVKNKKVWSSNDYNNFSKKVRARSDDLNIYIAKSLPKDSKHLLKINNNLFYDTISNIYLVDIGIYLPIVYALRAMFVKMKNESQSIEGKLSIEKIIFDYISSQSFTNYFNILKENIRELELIFNAINSNTKKGITNLSKIIDNTDILIETIENKKNLKI